MPNWEGGHSGNFPTNIMKPEIVYTTEYDPEFERDRLASMMPHARHQEMIEGHKQDKAQRRENHRKGTHKMKFTTARLA